MKDISYVIGYQIAQSNKKEGLLLVCDEVVEGYFTAMAGRPPKFSPAEMQKRNADFTRDFGSFKELCPDKDYTGDTSFPSYIIGLNVGGQLAASDADPFLEEELRAGFEDGLAGRPCRFGEGETRSIMAAFQAGLSEKAAQLVVKVKEESAAFLAENAGKEGVITTPSGLQYEVLKMGQGERPMATSTVEVHYAGTLLDGTEFDSSYRRNQPATFPLNQVIRGWTEGLQLMPVGSKFRFFIPSDLAYGDQGAGADIPGGAALIFEVELLSIK